MRWLSDRDRGDERDSDTGPQLLQEALPHTPPPPPNRADLNRRGYLRYLRDEGLIHEDRPESGRHD